MGRLRRVVRHAARRGRLPLDAGHPHRPAARRVRLGPGDGRHRGQHQPAAVRLHRPVRRRAAGALRAAPGRPSSPSLVISLGALGTTRMTEPWQLFLLWGVVVGVGSGCMATVFASTVASRWFVARRGLVTGALTAATASGQLVFLPLLLSRLADGVGWRWVGVTIAIGGAGRRTHRRAVPARPARPTSACCPYGATEADSVARRVDDIRADSRRVRRARRRLAQRRVLAAVRELLHLRAVDQRLDPDPLHLGRPRPHDQRVDRGRPPRADRQSSTSSAPSAPAG